MTGPVIFGSVVTSGVAKSLIELIHRTSNVCTGLMGVTLDHNHGLMTTDALHRWEVDARLYEMCYRAVCLRVWRTTCFGSRPAAFTHRMNAFLTSSVWPLRALTDGKSQGVPGGNVFR